MQLEKEVIEITEEQFESLDYSTIDAASILGTSEAELIRRFGSREGYPVTYQEIINYVRKKGMDENKIKEKILQKYNLAIVPAEKAKEYVRRAKEFDACVKRLSDKFSVC